MTRKSFAYRCQSSVGSRASNRTSTDRCRNILLTSTSRVGPGSCGILLRPATHLVDRRSGGGSGAPAAGRPARPLVRSIRRPFERGPPPPPRGLQPWDSTVASTCGRCAPRRPVYSRRGTSTRAQRVAPAARGGGRETGRDPGAEGEGRGPGLQRTGLPIRAPARRRALGPAPADVREDPPPVPRAAHPPRGLRPRRVGMSVLRGKRGEPRPRCAEVARGTALMGQRGRGVPAVQLPQGEPADRGGRDPPRAPTGPAEGRVPPVDRPPRTRVGALPLISFPLPTAASRSRLLERLNG